MKTTTIIAAVTALAFSLANVAFAQGQGDRAPHRAPVPQAHGKPTHRVAPPAAPRYRLAPPERQAREGRGAGPDHDFYRGGRLPPEYRNRSYVVDDWRGHRLSAPPRGYHWVQAGGDYVLVAITTGIILSILLNN